MLDPDTTSDYVFLASLIRAQGRHGELLAELLTDFPHRFAERPAVWLLPPAGPSAPRAATVERHWIHKDRIVLKFAGIDSINDAELLRGWRVAVPRAERMPLADDAVYIGDLVGCRVIDEATGNTDLGPVLDVARGEKGSADLLVLAQGEDELLIPFVKGYLVSIDLEGRTVRMRLPSGLTALNAAPTDEERSARSAAQAEE